MAEAGVHRVKQHTAVLGGLFALASVVHLVKEVVFASRFGTTPAMDAFSVVFVIPNLLATFLTGGVASALIPRAMRWAPEGEATPALGRFYRRVGGRLLIGVSLLAIGLELGGPWVVRALGAGFDPATRDLAARLHRVLTLSLPLSVAVGLGIAYCQGLSRFLVPGLAALLSPVVLVGILLRWGHQGIEVAAWGFVVGQAVALLVLGGHVAARLRPRGTSTRWPGAEDRDDALRAVGLVAIGWLAGMINLNVDLAMATTQPSSHGLAAVLRYSWKIALLPISFFMSTVSVALLPALSRSVAAGDATATRRSITFGVRVLVVLMIPAAVALFVLPQELVRALLERQSFSAQDTHLTAVALQAYAPSVLLHPLLSVLIAVHFARRRQGLVAVTSFVAVALNPLLNWWLMGPFGHVGIAVSTSIVALLQAVALIALDQDLRWALRNQGCWGAALRASLAAAVMATAVILLSDRLRMGAVASGLVLVAVGVAVFVVALWPLRGGELDEVLTTLRRRAGHSPSADGSS